VLGPTTIPKMISEPLQDPLGHLLSSFRYRVTHHLCPQTKPTIFVAIRFSLSNHPPFMSTNQTHHFCGVVVRSNHDF